jgi:hypothetical protein
VYTGLVSGRDDGAVFACLRAPQSSGWGDIIRVAACSSGSGSVGAPQARQKRCPANNSELQFLQYSVMTKVVPGSGFVVPGFCFEFFHRAPTLNSEPRTLNPEP